MAILFEPMRGAIKGQSVEVATWHDATKFFYALVLIVTWFAKALQIVCIEE
jgi:hypothetical protein